MPYRKPQSPLLPVMLGHIHIWLGPSDHFWFFTHDHSVVRWAPKNWKRNNVETLRRKNGTDLVSKPINWIWSCALRSFLLPHSSDDCSSKPLRRAFVTYSGDYMRLPIIIWTYPVYQVPACFAQLSSFTQVLRIHAQSSFRPQSTDSMRDVLVSGWLLSRSAFCSDTRVHNFL